MIISRANRTPSFGHSTFDDDFFTLRAPVGPRQPNRREDVIKVETILGNTGDHDLLRTDGPLGWWGEDQEKAVKTFQQRNGLKVDGLLKPGGPTIAGLKQAAGGLLGGLTPPTPDEVDEHHARLSQGESGLLNIRPARLSFPTPAQKLDLDEQSQAFNADSARALTRSGVDGNVPQIYANYLKEAGADGHAILFDLAEQVNATSGRDRADRILHGILGQLPADTTKALLGGDMPSRRPLGVRVADLPDDDKVPLFRAIALAAFPPVPQPGPAPGPTPTGGEEPEPEPKPQPKPAPPTPNPTPPIPVPEPRPTPNPEPESEPKPEPEPEPEPEPPKEEKCRAIQSRLGAARENQKLAEERYKNAVDTANKFGEEMGTKRDEYVSMIRRAVGQGVANCVRGGINGARGGWVGALLGCAAKAGPKAVQDAMKVSDAGAALDQMEIEYKQLNDAVKREEEERNYWISQALQLSEEAKQLGCSASE